MTGINLSYNSFRIKEIKSCLSTDLDSEAEKILKLLNGYKADVTLLCKKGKNSNAVSFALHSDGCCTGDFYVQRDETRIKFYYYDGGMEHSIEYSFPGEIRSTKLFKRKLPVSSAHSNLAT